MPFNHAESVPLSFQKCMTQPNLIDLDPNEYIEALNDNPFAVNIDRCVRCCNTLSNLLKRVCSKQNRRFKSKHLQYDYGNKWIESVNKAFFIQT